MLRSWKLGKLFGIPLQVHPTFWLLPASVLFTNVGGGLASMLFALVAVFLLFVCLVLHELGHALMARHFGIRTRDITLYPIGGAARLESMSEKPFEEVCIALAGPAVTLGIVLLLTPLVFAAFLFGLLSSEVVLSGTAGGALEVLAMLVAVLWGSNLFLLVFNLLPAFPMDGGRVLRALLARGLGLLRATEIAVNVSLVLTVLLAAAGLFFRQPFLVALALFVWFVGRQELLAVRYREAQRRAAALATALPGFGSVPVAPAEPVPAPATARDPNFTGFVWDRDYHVWVRWENGRPVQAYWGQAE